MHRVPMSYGVLLGLVVSLTLAAPGCASYRGSARDVSPATVEREVGWTRVVGVPLVRQKGIKDCGAAALSMVLEYWRARAGGGEAVSPRPTDRASIDRDLRGAPGEGLSARELRDYARKLGYAAFVFQGNFADLEHEVALGRPVIVGVHKPLSSGEALSHYEVLIGVNRRNERVLTLDPAKGMRQNEVSSFSVEWESAGRVTLVVLPEDDGDSASLSSRRRSASLR